MNTLNVFKVAVIVLMASLSTYATNGYFQHGYGTRASGMGGAAIAAPEDTFATVNNPAGLVDQKNRFDAELTWFNPIRSTTLMGTEFQSGATSFLMPNLGYSSLISETMSWGLTFVAAGGMNTTYDSPSLFNNPQTPQAVGTTNIYSNLAQMYLIPSWSMQLNRDHSVGVSLNVVYQTFEARGLQAFGIQDQGQDTSTGFGLRVGWKGRLTETLSLGATYQMETTMSAFSKYKGLFAEQGKFNIPATYGIGAQFKATESLTLALDSTWILYSAVKSLGNKMTQTAPLGADNGSGFGWADQNILKLGLAYTLNEDWTLRGGLNSAKMPVSSSQTMFNVLAPAVIESHYTLGATMNLGDGAELNLSYMYAPEVKLTGTDMATGYDLKMKQQDLHIGYSLKM
ncbi:MAG: hypothetical protein B7Y39_10830 [Bdellovibrio sp. 28-41-41]|nr:MAG: hypothetical protein B7Y39_10830 [Bdellovibrio sp. 28-41-41]